MPPGFLGEPGSTERPRQSTRRGHGAPPQPERFPGTQAAGRTPGESPRPGTSNGGANRLVACPRLSKRRQPNRAASSSKVRSRSISSSGGRSCVVTTTDRTGPAPWSGVALISIRARCPTRLRWPPGTARRQCGRPAPSADASARSRRRAALRRAARRHVRSTVDRASRHIIRRRTVPQAQRRSGTGPWPAATARRPRRPPPCGRRTPAGR